MRTGSLTDEQLISLQQQTQSQEGFDLLYKQYAQKVYQTCLKLIGDSEEARDATQDIFLKVFGKLDAFQHRSTFSTWLYSVAYNHCVDTIRQNKRLPTETLLPQTDYPADNPSYEAMEETIQLLKHLLRQLPSDDQLLLTLKYEQGLSVRAISQRFQMKECAIKMRLKRSRDRLCNLYLRQNDH